MVKKYLWLLAASVIIASSCSDDESQEVLQTNLKPTAINFVKPNGDPITNFNCADLRFNYAIKIDATFEAEAPLEGERIDFTINGNIYTVTFLASGSKIVPVELRSGNNIAIIRDGNVFSSTLFVIDQGDFILVP